MKDDFLQIIRLSPISFTISLPQKTQPPLLPPPPPPPRYAEPHKNKNMKIKLFTLQHKIKYFFLAQQGTKHFYISKNRKCM